MDGKKLRPQLRRLFDQVSELRATAEPRLSALTEQQLVWHADPNGWSIAEILDHLDRSNSYVIPIFDHSLEKAGPAGAEAQATLKYSLFENWLVASVSPGSPIKLPVARVLRPKISPKESPSAVKRFLEQLGEYAALIQEADELRVGGIRITSPVNPLIRMHWLPYVDAMIQHERYHWTQVEAILENSSFPKSVPVATK